MIVTISDYHLNGKCGYNKNCIEQITFDYHIFLHQLTLTQDNLIINNLNINFSNITIIIFNFNEDGYGYYRSSINKDIFSSYKEFQHYLIQISLFIQKKYPHIIIYNDPNKCFEIADKYLTYSGLKQYQNDFFKIPKNTLIKTRDDLDTVDYFPCLLKINGNLCNMEFLDQMKKYEMSIANKSQLLDIYIKYRRMTNVDLLVIEYIDSYNPIIKQNHSIRLFFMNEQLLETHYFSSNNYRVQGVSSDMSIYNNNNIWFLSQINNHMVDLNMLFKNLFQYYGHTINSLDAIYKNNKIYLCEINLKYGINELHQHILKHNIPIKYNKKQLKDKYKQIISINKKPK